MEEIAHILDAIAWPITAIVIVHMLRKPIESLIPLLRRLKYKELEVEFERSLDEIDRRTIEEKKALPPAPERESEEEDFLDQIRDLSPRAAILETWLEFEHTAYFMAQKFKLIGLEDRRTRFFELLRVLQQREILYPNDVQDIKELQSLRNTAVHERDISLSKEDAVKYAKVAMQVADVLVARAFKLYGKKAE